METRDFFGEKKPILEEVEQESAEIKPTVRHFEGEKNEDEKVEKQDEDLKKEEKESIEEIEKGEYEKIEEASDLKGVKNALREISGVKHGDRFYTSDELIDLIKIGESHVFSKHLINDIPQEHGLREKVIKLVESRKTETNLNQQREEEFKKAKVEADSRNKYRNIFQRVLGKNKAIAEDILQEQALDEQKSLDVSKKEKKKSDFEVAIKTRAEEIYKERAERGELGNGEEERKALEISDWKRAEAEIKANSTESKYLKLESYRKEYASLSTEFNKNFSKDQKKYLEETIESICKTIQLGDFENLKLSKDSQEHKEALKRKNKALEYLNLQKISGKEAEKVVEMEMMKLEYESSRESFGKKLYQEKNEELNKKGISGEVLENELKRYCSTHIFNKIILEENGLFNQEILKSRSEKETSVFKKLLIGWSQMPKSARWAISASVATGFALSVGSVTGGMAALSFAGYKFGRAALSSFTVIGAERIAALGIKGWDKTIGKEKTEEFRTEKLREDIGKDLLDNLNKISKEHRKILEETSKRTKRQNIGKWAAAALAGGGFMLAGGELEKLKFGFGPNEAFAGEGNTYVVGAKAAVVEKAPISDHLKIGTRGPEGALIDEFKNNSVFAKKMAAFGWSEDNVGDKAHEVWLKSAKEALKDPAIKQQMDDLGYAHDMEGYAKMMHRIGKGTVEVETDGKIKLVDETYLKAPVEVKSVDRVEADRGPRIAEITDKNIIDKLNQMEHKENGPRVVEVTDQHIVDKLKQLDTERLAGRNESGVDNPRIVNVADQSTANLLHDMDELRKLKVKPHFNEHSLETNYLEKDIKPDLEIKSNDIIHKALEISPEKRITFERIFNDPRPSTMKVRDMISLVEQKKITTDDIADYYVMEVEKIKPNSLSAEHINNIRKSLKLITLNDPEGLKARRGLEIKLNDLAVLKNKN